MTLKVLVKYLANIYSITKKKDEDLEIENGSSLGNLVDALTAKYGPAMREEILGPEDAIRHNIFILVNGNGTKNLGFELKDGDVVVISPVVTGG
jgi:MoaD family protein